MPQCSLSDLRRRHPLYDDAAQLATALPILQRLFEHSQTWERSQADSSGTASAGFPYRR